VIIVNRSLPVSALALALTLAGCSSPDSDPAEPGAAASSADSAPAASNERVDFAAVAAEEAARTMEVSDFSASTDSDWEQPMTSWGDPDLRGTWPINHLTGVPLQRDPALGERRYLNEEEMRERTAQYGERSERLGNEVEGNQLGMGHWVEWGQLNNIASLIIDPPDGQLPALTEEGERRRALMRSGWMEDIPFDHYNDFDNWDRCITRGLPASMLPSYYNAGIQILQTPGYVVLRLEMIHETRIIPVDGRPPVDAGTKAWLGYSNGHWEGNTLVVETTNFNGKGSSTNIHTIGSPPYNNSPISEEYVLTERFTRTGPNTLTYQATVHDPVIWTADWTVELPWVLDNDYRFFEYACAEDNVMIRNYINSSRAERGLL
jgi:hypothetical protein